jgi:hypothetical protein
MDFNISALKPTMVLEQEKPKPRSEKNKKKNKRKPDLRKRQQS